MHWEKKQEKTGKKDQYAPCSQTLKLNEAKLWEIFVCEEQQKHLMALISTELTAVT